MAFGRFLSLDDDTIMEIFGSLSALDVIRCRKVCRQLYRCSKASSVWLKILAKTACALPSFDSNSLTSVDVEKMLIRAEILDERWTGIRRSPPTIQNLPPIGLDLFCVGTVGPYIVLGSVGPLPKYSWFDKGALNLDRPVFTFAPPADRPYHTVCSNFSMEPDKGTLRVVVIEAHNRTNERRLKVFSIRVDSHGNCTVHLDQAVVLPQDIATEVSEDEGFVPNIKGEYIALMPQFGQAAGMQRLILVHIGTGKIVLSPLHIRYGPVAPNMGHIAFGMRVSIFITSTYLIQVLDGRDFEFFDLPTPSKLLETASPIHARRTPHSVSLPYSLTQIYIYPRSTLSFAVVGLSYSSMPPDEVRLASAGHRIVLSSIELPGQSTVSAGPTAEEQCSCSIVPGLNTTLLPESPSPLSASALGVMTVDKPPLYPSVAPGTRTPYRRWYFKAIRVVFGSESRKPELTIIDLDVPIEQVEGHHMSFRTFDPYRGQLVLQFTNFRQIGDYRRKLVLLDYLLSGGAPS